MFYFLHISKCAGSTFVELAARNTILFRPNANGNPLNPLTGKRLAFWQWSPGEQQYLLSSPICGLIANENVLGRKMEFYEGVTYVTILRDPIDRLFSYYQFNHERPDKEESLEDRGRKFAKFLRKDVGLGWRKNSIVSALTHPSRDEHSPRRLALAKERLAQFDHVFVMENLSEQVATLSEYGWSDLAVQWRKATQPGEAAFRWSAAREALKGHQKVADRLLAENEQDLELYAFARELAKQRETKRPKLQRLPTQPNRVVPDSTNFEFLVFCAYEAFLTGDAQRCAEILKAAASCSSVGVPKGKHDGDFVAMGLKRFAAPEQAEAERLARTKLRVARMAATA